MRSLLYTFLFLLQISFIFGKNPEQIVCAVDNETCLIAETGDMFAELGGGSTSLHTEPLDPMFIDYLRVDQDFKEDLRDVEVTGIKNAVIEHASVDLTTKIFRIQFATDLVVNSQYINSGNLLSMPIEGEGHFLMKFYNTLIDMIVTFDIIKDASGDDVMILKSHTYTYDVRDNAEFAFDNLYYGKNKTASDAMHKAMSENWKPLTIEFGKYLFDPLTEKIFNAILIYARSRPLKEFLEY